MAVHDLTGPDGSVYDLTVPDDATPEQIATAAQQAAKALSALSVPGGSAIVSPPGTAWAGGQPAMPPSTAPLQTAGEPPGQLGGHAVGEALAARPAGPRPFWSTLPSAAGAMAGAARFARVPGPWPVKAASAILGAGLGGYGAERALAQGEEATGSAPLEPGKTPNERGVQAGLVSAGAQALGGIPAAGARYVAGGILPGLQAIGRLGETLAQGLTIGKGGITHIRAADGTMRTLAKALDDPRYLADLGGAHASSMATLARAWWQEASALGPHGLVEAFRELGKKAQRTLFGERLEDVATVVRTIAGGERAHLPYGKTALSYLMGGPAAAGTLATVDFAREKALPFLFSQGVTRPALAVPMTRAVQAADFLAPIATPVARGTLQTGARGLFALDEGNRARSTRRRP